MALAAHAVGCQSAALARELKRHCVEPGRFVQLYALPPQVLHACRIAGLEGPTSSPGRFVAAIDGFVDELEAAQQHERLQAHAGVIAKTVAMLKRRTAKTLPPSLSSSSSLFLEAARTKRCPQVPGAVADARAWLIELLREAIAARASSLHFEFDGGEPRIHYRIDGALHAVASRRLLTMRIVHVELLTMATLRTTDSRLPQSARCLVRIDDETVRLCVEARKGRSGETSSSASLTLLDGINEHCNDRRRLTTSASSCRRCCRSRHSPSRHHHHRHHHHLIPSRPRRRRRLHQRRHLQIGVQRASSAPRAGVWR